MTRYWPTWSYCGTENIGETSRTSNTHFQFINLSTILKEKDIQAHLLSQSARRKLLNKNTNIYHEMALKDTRIRRGNEIDVFSDIESFRGDGGELVDMDHSLKGSVYSDLQDQPLLDLRPKPRLSGMSVEQSTMILEFVKKQFKYANKSKNSIEDELDKTLLGDNSRNIRQGNYFGANLFGDDDDFANAHRYNSVKFEGFRYQNPIKVSF